MMDIVDGRSLRNAEQNIEHAQPRSNRYRNSQAPDTLWQPCIKDRYNDQQVENQMPKPLGIDTGFIASSARRPSSEPLTPHYRIERVQRSGTEAPAIKTESAMMPHTPVPMQQLIGTNQGPQLRRLSAQAPTPARLFQEQAATVQLLRPLRGLASTAMEAENYHAGGSSYAHTNIRSQPSLYQAQFSPYPSNGSSGFSEATNPTAAEQSPLSAAGPLFYPPRHQDKSPLRSHYDTHRRHPREQYQGPGAPQYHSQFNEFPSNLDMSLSFETHQFSEYPQTDLMHNPHQGQKEMQEMHRPQYPSPPPPLSNPYNPQPILDAAAALIDDDMAELRQKSESDAPSPGRSKPIPKPDREVTKDADGRFVCTWPGCTEDVRNFGRKCEWSKHMDKHDRPYKCPSDGCEKLPGFTYSGGLLRHQREVHNLHGGPRKQLNCPHPTCKRYSGKGFSRQENLNEHLRRVHTDGSEMPVGEDLTEDDGNERAGMKRKRGSAREDDFDWRQEVARLRQENEEMKRTTESLMRQLQSLQGIVGSSIQRAQQSHQAPPANML